MKYILVFSILLLSGCTTTQKYAATGAIVGSTVGGAIGYQSGDSSQGAAIGALTGGSIGVVLGEQKKQKLSDYDRGFESGYRQGQADLAKTMWNQNTGKCANTGETVLLIDGIPNGRVQGVIYQEPYQEVNP